jgi:hypothetical protein
MKTKSLFIVILGFLVFLIAAPAHSWQGRMGGMGDPYGLVQDESDFLIHPAGIANGKGINFYGGYRFNYTDVMDWNFSFKYFGVGNALYPAKSSGDEYQHDALLGAAFPLGPGRMGLFFQYSGRRGNYDGKEIENDFGTPNFSKFNLDSDLDSFALRLLYGLPMGGFKLGSEIQLAYRREENKSKFYFDIFGTDVGPAILTNNPLGQDDFSVNTFPFMMPYNSKYWEALLKGSLEGAVGPAKIAFTMWGGIIFSGDNKLDFRGLDITGPTYFGSSMKGDVKGWRTGSDLWLRYPLAEGLSLPFLVKIGYQSKNRDGDGPVFGGMGTEIFDYKNKEKNFWLEVGGGVDKELAKGTRIAAGIYYSYLWNKNAFILNDTAPGGWAILDNSPYPEHKEHRVILKLAGEKEICPMTTMRMGMNFFYGWVKEDFIYHFSDSTPSFSLENNFPDGYHWGIGAFLGGTVKFNRFSVEPFISGGYQKLSLNGSGVSPNLIFLLTESDKLRKEWSIGGGLSIKF